MEKAKFSLNIENWTKYKNEHTTGVWQDLGFRLNLKMVLYKRFRGAEPSIEPLLRKRGLDKKTEPLKKVKG